jgi:hypothetical protein
MSEADAGNRRVWGPCLGECLDDVRDPENKRSTTTRLLPRPRTAAASMCIRRVPPPEPPRSASKTPSSTRTARTSSRRPRGLRRRHLSSERFAPTHPELIRHEQLGVLRRRPVGVVGRPRRGGGGARLRAHADHLCGEPHDRERRGCGDRSVPCARLHGRRQEPHRGGERRDGQADCTRRPRRHFSSPTPSSRGNTGTTANCSTGAFTSGGYNLLGAGCSPVSLGATDARGAGARRARDVEPTQLRAPPRLAESLAVNAGDPMQ